MQNVVETWKISSVCAGKLFGFGGVRWWRRAPSRRPACAARHCQAAAGARPPARCLPDPRRWKQELTLAAPCPPKPHPHPCAFAPPLQYNVSLHALVDSGAPPEEQEAEKEAQFFWDENHPWDRTGHRHVCFWGGGSQAVCWQVTGCWQVTRHASCSYGRQWFDWKVTRAGDRAHATLRGALKRGQPRSPSSHERTLH